MKIVQGRDIEYLETLTSVSCNKLRVGAVVDALTRISKESNDSYLKLHVSRSKKNFFESLIKNNHLPENLRIKVVVA